MPLGFPASSCCHVGTLSLTACVLLESHLPNCSPRPVPPAREDNKKVTPNHRDTWQSGTWECWGHPSCSVPSPSPPPRTEEQERPGWRSRLGCRETNPEWYHSAVSQRPTPVPKRHRRGSAALRMLRFYPEPVAFPWDRSGPGCAGRCCPSACSLRIHRPRRKGTRAGLGWPDRQTSARRGQGTRGRPRHSRQRPGDTWQSHGDTLRSKGPLPSVPPLPCRPCGAGNAAPARTLLAPGPAALCALETLHHGDAPREQLLGDVRGCV